MTDLKSQLSKDSSGSKEAYPLLSTGPIASEGFHPKRKQPQNTNPTSTAPTYEDPRSMKSSSSVARKSPSYYRGDVESAIYTDTGKKTRIVVPNDPDLQSSSSDQDHDRLVSDDDIQSCSANESNSRGGKIQVDKSTSTDSSTEPSVVVKEPKAKKEKKKKEKKEKPPKPKRREVTSIPQTNMAIGCLVTLCFNPLFGFVAMYCSLRAASAYRDGDVKHGASRARNSIFLSLFGIATTMIIVASLVVYFAVDKHNNAGKLTPSGGSGRPLGL